MAKNVFKPGEINFKPRKVFIQPPIIEVEEDIEEISSLDEYTGPTVDDLRREAEAFRESWEDEKQGMLEKAQA